MGIFNPDFSAVEAGIPIIEDGARYRLLVKAAKPVIKESKDEKTGVVTEKAHMQFNLEMKGRFDSDGKLVTDGFDGKTVSPFKAYITTEGGWKFSKSFILAAGGYTGKEEALANTEFFQANTWIINGEPGAAPENIEVGTGWAKCVDRLVDVTLTKKIDKFEGKEEFESQNYNKWAPVK